MQQVNHSNSESVEFERPLVEPEQSRPTTWLTSEGDKEEFEPPTVEKMYYKVLDLQPRGCGKYQWLTSVIIMCALVGFGYFEYIISYLELIPQVNCYQTPDVLTVDCSMQELCLGQTTPQIPYYVEYNNRTSLHNWVEPLNLYCTPGYKLALLGSLYFAGWSCTILGVPYLADKKGRK